MSLMQKKSKSKSRIKKQDIINLLDDKTIVPTKHPDISGVTVIGDLNTFPISWLQKREYCEYQVYLEHVKKIKAGATIEMIIGSKEHHRLEAEFKEEAEPATFEEMITLSETYQVFSRELPVVSFNFGIHGLIDEVIMSPDKYIIIDDKPGKKVYSSSIHQVFGYCLSFKEMTKDLGQRKIYGAVRERGTDNIVWQAPFDDEAEKEIINIVERLHRQINGEEEFKPTKNPNKCTKCRFIRYCDKKAV